MNSYKKIALLGSGGLAEECVEWILQNSQHIDYLYDSTIPYDKTITLGNREYVVSNKFRERSSHIMAVGYPSTKKAIIGSITANIKLHTPIIHYSSVLGSNIQIGEGSIVCPLATLTSDIIIGAMSSINSLVTISHNCRIGNMFHASPGASVSGNVTIGDRVFLGTNACIKEKITICDDVVIGSGSVVIRDITKPGHYAGNPISRLVKL